MILFFCINRIVNMEMNNTKNADITINNQSNIELPVIIDKPSTFLPKKITNILCMM